MTLNDDDDDDDGDGDDPVSFTSLTTTGNAPPSTISRASLARLTQPTSPQSASSQLSLLHCGTASIFHQQIPALDQTGEMFRILLLTVKL
ncbi:hypothetical protein PoB_007215300 [Plakobranchus ocellatus]|uniref:Uncharacterized protein n=1 Tax=Plakobranchus ocellatus TaxID=259542 RepID=A0AAV4DMV6_9GAST|nr:hypothetical protein PoB_007215300 [Plakobranchus ocellatus]